MFDPATYESRSGKSFWMAETDTSSLTRFIAELQAELQQTREASVAVMLSQLRAREAVLLYVGQDAEQFAQQIAEEFGGDIARAVSSSLFVLDNAPVPPEVREAFRKATNHGMNRW